MKFNYNHTKYTCYLAYITSALVNNFAPLLFVTFQKTFSLTIEQIGMLVSANFITQMIVDFLGANFADKIGYRKTIITANLLAITGFCMMAFLPGFMANKLLALLVSTVVYGVGSGLIEVMISPMVEALPLDAKSSAMSMLHSFYCWGSVIVIALSSLFFAVFGTENWRILTVLWTLVPLVTTVMFCFVPIISLSEDGESDGTGKLFSSSLFWLFMVLMTCSGAAELAVAQWASMFAESGLGVSKTVGDLLGPCMFAVLMGVARVLYAVFHDKWRLRYFIAFCSVGCIGSYLLTALSPNPIISLVGCALCGFFVAIVWPGTLSLAAKYTGFKGTTMFGILALGGDVGCTLGPAVVAAGSSLNILSSPIRTGILCAIVFPVLMLFVITMINRKISKKV